MTRAIEIILVVTVLVMAVVNQVRVNDAINNISKIEKDYKYFVNKHNRLHDNFHLFAKAHNRLHREHELTVEAHNVLLDRLNKYFRRVGHDE